MKQLHQRTLITLLCLVLSTGLLAGCARQTDALPPGGMEHEVLTLKPIPADKMMITLQGVDGVDLNQMEREIEAHFPDVDIVQVLYTWLKNDLEHNSGQDIVLNQDLSWLAEHSDNLVDLTTESYLQNYSLSSLSNCAINGSVYVLPGPAHVYGIVYNQDMFQANGWKIPKNLDEFIQLCQTIESTGIRAFQPALYYKDAMRQFLAGFTYQPAFYGLENSMWFSDYHQGTATMANHLEPALDNLKQLSDAGIIRTSDFKTTPAGRSAMMYQKRNCAMIIESQNAEVYAREWNLADQPVNVGMMPFFSGNEPNSDFLFTVPQYYMGINSKLEQPGNEEKLQRVKEILGWLSTVEGQTAIMDSEALAISHVRGVPWKNTSFFQAAQATIAEGRLIPQPMLSQSFAMSVESSLQETLPLFMEGTLAAQDVTRTMDQAHDKEQQHISNYQQIGHAEEDFTVLQLAQLMADIFRERANAQIGLCQANTRQRGVGIKLYQGELYYNYRDTALDWRLEQGFLPGNAGENSQKLMRVQMTGQALLDLLNSTTEDKPAYWVASGMKIVFAPWAGDGNRIISATLANGEPLQPEAIYTVALWNGAADEKYILKTETYFENSITDLFKERVAQTGSIKPEWDEDFILDWSIVKTQPENNAS